MFVPEISSEVIALCRRIHPSNGPGFVTVRPHAAAQPLDCFMNVQTKVNSDGGRIQYGWAIWKPSRFFIEAEHHAVYEPPTGPPWIDVTPPQHAGVTRTLFLPDDAAVYDMNSDQRRDNVRMPLVDDERAKEFCRLCVEATDVWNSVPGVGMVSVTRAQAARLQEIEIRKAMIMMQLEQAYPQKLGRNDRCPCGSGKKYKKCCAA